MNNLDRLKMEIEIDDITDDKLEIYLQENNLESTVDYVPTSATNKKNIYRTALSILESIANNPKLMRTYKTDDITVTQFSENIQSRIDQLDRKVRLMATDDDNTDGNSFIYIFTD